LKLVVHALKPCFKGQNSIAWPFFLICVKLSRSRGRFGISESKVIHISNSSPFITDHNYAYQCKYIHRTLLPVNLPY